MAEGKSRVYDLSRRRQLEPHGGKVELILGPHEARVIELHPRA
jgi:hypothetical protein